MLLQRVATIFDIVQVHLFKQNKRHLCVVANNKVTFAIDKLNTLYSLREDKLLQQFFFEVKHPYEAIKTSGNIYFQPFVEV